MSNIFEGFVDNLFTGTLNPKGNLADYSHASRTFVKNQYRLAPKVKFLYHVYFEFNPNTISKILPTWKDRHTLESGLMVKSVTLPSFSANIETKKKYNRTKHTQTGVNYNPVSMVFHDDNLGMMTGLLESYFRYYYTDGYGEVDMIRQAFQKNSSKNARTVGVDQDYIESKQNGDNTYKNRERNQNLLGLNGRVGDPFFRSIHINQMTRRTFTKFILVNPIISSWGFGDMNYASGSEVNELTVEVNYESVWIERGSTEAGRSASPTGFGNLAHYDVTPSPLNITGGGAVSLTSSISAFGDIVNSFTPGDNNRSEADLYDYKQAGKKMTGLGALIGGINLIKNIGQLTPEGVVEEVGNLINAGLENFYDNRVSGVDGIKGENE